MIRVGKIIAVLGLMAFLLHLGLSAPGADAGVGLIAMALASITWVLEIS